MATDEPSPGRPPRHRRVGTYLALAGAALMLGFYAFWTQATVRTPPPILPPAGEALPGEAPFSFAILGDSRGNMSVFEDILDHIRSDKAAFVLHTGDIVRRPQPAQFDWVLHELNEEEPGLCIFAVAGNHDIDRKATDPAKRYLLYNRAFGQRRYWFSYADALFVAFDDAQEALAPDELEWLDDTLSRLRDRYKLCFVYMHEPPRDPRPGYAHALEGGADQLVATLARHHVTAVFASHIHGYLTDNLDGVPEYITGGAGAELDMPESGFHYLLCTVGADGAFQVTKHDVPAHSDDDYPEYAFRTKFAPHVTLFAGAVLLTLGLVLLLRPRAARP